MMILTIQKMLENSLFLKSICISVIEDLNDDFAGEEMFFKLFCIVSVSIFVFSLTSLRFSDLLGNNFISDSFIFEKYELNYN